MSVFLETLRARLAESQKRHQEATNALQAAQNFHQVVTQELFGWQKAIEAESRREAHQQVIAAAKEPTATVPAAPLEAIPSAVNHSDQSRREVNKTDAIRKLLREHGTGITPGEVWDALKDQIGGNRDYVYSVLKRLKDSDQVVVRRGKYYLREITKAEEVKPTIGIQ
jgi:hypothetical protein